MIWKDRNEYPKEITINLEKYKEDRAVTLKCFVAHDYIRIDKGILIEDINNKGYWINAKMQIPINIMVELLEKLKTSPHLQKEHADNKGYLYKDEVVLFEEWHFDKENKDKQRSLYLVRERGDKDWIEVKKELFNDKKLEIIKKLK